MKKIIPFTKEIPFQDGISEILSISLDHDLSIKNQVLMGNFYLRGKYLTKEEKEEEYSYKIPFEISINDKYDIDDTEFDIEDFYYDVIDSEKLKVNIEVYIDGLIEKEEPTEEKVAIKLEDDWERNEDETTEEENIVKVEDVLTNINSNNDEKYETYNIYIFRDNDTLSEIMEKYHTNKELLQEYNDLESIQTGSKIIIPSRKDE